MNRKKLLAWLFGVSLYISAFTFGGGYVVIPMIRKFYVQKRNLMSENDLMDLAAFAQSSPGAIAVNTASLAGYRAGGPAGLAVCFAGTILPPIAILAVIAANYAFFRDNTVIATVLHGMEAGVAAVVVDFVIDMCAAVFRQGRALSTVLVPVAFVCCFFLNVNVALILAACVGLSVLESAVRMKKERRARDASGAPD